MKTDLRPSPQLVSIRFGRHHLVDVLGQRSAIEGFALLTDDLMEELQRNLPQVWMSG